MKLKGCVKLGIGIVLAAVLVTGLVLLGGCAPGVEAPPVTAPPEEEPTFHWRVQVCGGGPGVVSDVFQPWLDEIEEATGGRMEFEVYASGEIVPDDQAISAVASGTLDLTTGNAPAFAAPIDIEDFSGAPPFAWRSPDEFQMLVYRKGLKGYFAESYEEIGGIHWIGVFQTDPNHLFSTRPIEKYEDLEGLRIHTYETVGAIFEEAGAMSVFFPFEDVFLAGQTGEIDAVSWSGTTEVYVNGWYEVFPYFLTNPLCGAWTVSVLANEESWNALPSDMQAIFEQSILAQGARTIAYYYEGEQEHRKHFTCTTMPEEDWVKIVRIGVGKWEEIGKKSPRCAAMLEIIRGYNREIGAPGW